MYKKSAEQENSDGQYQLGRCYKDGIGIEKDEAKAFEWYKKSAEEENNYRSKNKIAQYNLGGSYERGDGVEKDEVKAFD